MLTVKTVVARPYRRRQGDLTTYAMITLTAQAGGSLPANLVLLFDTSGSMQGEMLEAAKEVARLASSQLRDGDVISLVTFDTTANVVVPAGRVGVVRDKLNRAIDNLQAGGITQLRPALAAARLELLKNSAGHSSVAILISDGYPTNEHGEVDEVCEPYYAEAGLFNVSSLSLLAVGLGNAENYNNTFLQKLAEHGNGRHHYSDGPAGLEPFFREELQVMKNTSIIDTELVFNTLAGKIQRFDKVYPDVQMFHSSEDGETVFKLGSLPEGKPQAYILELIVPGSIGVEAETTEQLCRFSVHYRTGSGSASVQDAANIIYTSNLALLEREDANIMEMVKRLELAFYAKLMEENVIANNPKKTMRVAQHVATLADQLKMTQQADLARTVYKNTVTGNLHKTTRDSMAKNTQSLSKTVSVSSVNFDSNPQRTR